ncbi:type I-F CRISPR-associated endoribonuclease Cas6/Csy4 [Photobacterium leiognathi]|uniref:type I-F CRISPR-associated endoribonuclease Cas6/Csy4 n=1 Tax=Photobacterium leiognathi TaxID=553611 RepID=UPI000D1511AC|nr:type I-F CRISPR-associated endoribonuclease Cas6/Csy4 [Photobacterium leiognathi]PSW39371.1 type I-F CRISPR-associated endoribonuclease Cas6/Csy4 [Photobacterium leiognathi subsp. mandapamensis]
MEQRYYFAINFLPNHVDAELLAGRCISVLHGFMRMNEDAKNTIGISFPFWSEDSIGNVITFVSVNKECLCGLSYQPYFTLMKKEQIFEISPIIAVASDLPEHRFIRNSTIDKSFLNSKNKRLKRIEARAIKSNRQYSPVSREGRAFDLFHSIPMTSKGTECEFVLHIQQQSQELTRIDNQFNTYGFATNEKWLGTVPDLRDTLLFE